MDSELTALQREVVASLPDWVTWAGAPALALACAVALAAAVRLGYAVAHVVGGGLRVEPGAHWSHHARVEWAARATANAIAYLGVLGAIASGQRWFGELSRVPPVIAGLLAGLGALLGAWMALPRSHSPTGIALRAWSSPRRIRAWLAWMTVKLPALVLVPLVLVATPGRSPWNFVPALLGAVASMAISARVAQRGYVMGRLHPTPDALQKALDEACVEVGSRPAKLVLAEIPSANAVAIRGSGHVVASTLLVDSLTPGQLHAILRHEAAHLTQVPRVGPLTIFSSLALFGLPWAFVTGIVPGIGLTLAWFWASARATAATKAREHAADSRARACDPEQLSEALWRIHELGWVPIRAAGETHPDLVERATSAKHDADRLELRAPRQIAISLGVAAAIILHYVAIEFYRKGGADGTLTRAAWDIAVTGGAREDLREWGFTHWYDGDPAVARAAALLLHAQAPDPYLLALAGLADIALGAAPAGEARIQEAMRIASEARWLEGEMASLVEWVEGERSRAALADDALLPG
jgi:Zn-dependent protease with chaperone function